MVTDKDSAVEHIPEERLLAYLDDELDGSRRAAVAEHLLRCRRCAGRLDGLRSASDLLSQALEDLDVEPPARDADLRIRTDSRGSRGARRAVRVGWIRAAALVLVVGGASAAAIPGSPVRAWIEESVDRFLAGSESTEEQAFPAARPDQGMSGVAARPLYGRIVVDVLGAAPGTTLRVRLVEGPEAMAWSAAGRYRTGPGHIEILGGGREVRVDLPRDATFAEVRVEGEPVSRLTDSQLVPLAQVERSGSELLFRIGR